MVYSINGKVYTSNPMLDDIVYNTKLLLNGIVVKNEYVANQYETEETVRDAEIYSKCLLGNITYTQFPFTEEILVAYGYTPDLALYYLHDMSKVPISEQQDLLNFSISYYVDHFEEKNKYYRSLIGLPEYNTTEFDIYLSASDFPPDFDISTVDFSLPIHLQPDVVIGTLKFYGTIEKIIENNRSFNYSYLRFLGDRSLNLYNVRKASKWDILYIPDVDAAIKTRFQELYSLNKEIYLRRVYQEAYAFNSTYYDHCMIILLLSQTFNDMIVDVPEWYIRRDILDIRTVQYFLESYGVTFFEEIPLKYQIRIVKNLNKLITFKSSEENFNDIIEIFALKEVFLYKYFLYKRHKVDEYGQYITSDDLNKMYDLNFIEVLLGDTYDNYIKDLAHRTPYDELTLTDKYWDGTDDHDTVKEKILERQFTIEPSKYMTLKANIDYPDYQKQLKYFMSLVLDSRINYDYITIGVSTISQNTGFKISDLFLFVELATNLYFGMSNDIIRPEDVRPRYTEYKEDFVPNLHVETINTEWWLKERYPEIFKTYDYDRVYGFNPELDMEYVQSVVNRKFTNFRLKNYSLADFGCDKYIVVPNTITTIEELMDIYETNIECFDQLNTILTHRCDTEDKNLLGHYIFNELFTKSYDYGFAGSLDNLVQVLQSRDYTLWSFYKRLASMTDKETMKKDIENILNEVVTNLEYYLSRESLNYLFSFVPVQSFSAILHYIYLMLNAFKSYKAHFIEPTITYQMLYPDVTLGNALEFDDTFFNIHSSSKKWDSAYLNDAIAKKVIKYCTDSINRINFVEILDIFTLFDPDREDNYDYDGMTAQDQPDIPKNANGGTAQYDIPFIMLNGHSSFGTDFTQWNIDGRYSEINPVYEVDAGNVADTNQVNWFNTTSDVTLFKYMINGFSINDDKFVNNNFFIRLTDTQKKPDMSVSAKTGLKYSESEDKSMMYLTEFWREWCTVEEFETREHLSTFAKLYYNSTNKPAKTLYQLDNFYNNGIDISIEDIYLEGAEPISDDEFDWNFGDEDSDEIVQTIDKNFGDIDIGDEGNVVKDIEFGEENENSSIIFISSMGNKDTSRIITTTAQ